MPRENTKKSTAFGRQLKMWRQKRGLSQLDLAVAAATTPRYLSFIESGRSRPGKELVLRLAMSLKLSIRNQNALLQAAGLPAQVAENRLTESQFEPFRLAVEQILVSHNPYPASALDVLGRVVTCNEAHRRLAPECEHLSPEEHVDMWFAPGPVRDSIENWAEVAWAWVDRQLRVAVNTNNQRLSALVDRAMEFLADVERPELTSDDSPEVLTLRFRIGDQVIRTFTTVMQFESAMDIALSELRIELMFPMDQVSRDFFHKMATASVDESAS